MDIFLARRSNQVPSLWPPEASEVKVLDFCRLLMSKAVVMVATMFSKGQMEDEFILRTGLDR
jgi:hypothetical protein